MREEEVNLEANETHQFLNAGQDTLSAEDKKFYSLDMNNLNFKIKVIFYDKKLVEILLRFSFDLLCLELFRNISVSKPKPAPALNIFRFSGFRNLIKLSSNRR